HGNTAHLPGESRTSLMPQPDRERSNLMWWRTSAAAAAVVGWALWLTPACRADVKPNALIGDGMVLQQQAKVHVWGTADPGEKVSVRFRDQDASTEADGDGHWSVRLDSKEAGGPFALDIEGKNKISVKDVLV